MSNSQGPGHVKQSNSSLISELDDQQKSSHPSTPPSAVPSVSRLLARKRKRDETALTSESSPSKTFQRGLLPERDGSSRESRSPHIILSLRQNQDYGANVSGFHQAVGSHPKPMLPSISGGEPGSPGQSVEQDQEVQDVPYQTSDYAVLKGKAVDQQQRQGLPSGEGEIAEPVPLQQVIKLSEIKDWSDHHSREDSTFQSTSNGTGNQCLTENRNRPRTLKLNKCSPPREKEKSLRPPSPPLRLSSPTIMQDFMIPFVESDAKDIKFREQFPPGFDYDLNSPKALKYRLLAYQSKYHRRREKAHMDNLTSIHLMHQSPSSQQEQYLSETQQHLETGSKLNNIIFANTVRVICQSKTDQRQYYYQASVQTQTWHVWLQGIVINIILACRVTMLKWRTSGE